MSSSTPIREIARLVWRGSGHSPSLFVLIFPLALVARWAGIDIAKPVPVPAAVTLLYRDETTMLEQIWCRFPSREYACLARDALQDFYGPMARFYFEGERPSILVALDAPGDWQVVNRVGDKIADKVSREAAFELLKQMHGQQLIAQPCWQEGHNG